VLFEFKCIFDNFYRVWMNVVFNFNTFTQIMIVKKEEGKTHPIYGIGCVIPSKIFLIIAMNLFIVFNFDNKTFRWQAVGATIKKKNGVICRISKLAVYAKDLDTKVHQTPPVVKSSYTRFIHGHRGKRSLKSLLLKLLRPDMERYPNGFTGFNP
jgi:hypothetical protein